MRGRSDYDILKALLDTMGADNGCVFQPCSQHLAELAVAVSDCRRDGLKFTTHQICTITYGEQTDQQKLVNHYQGYDGCGPRLSKILNVIFDGCSKCSTGSQR